MPTYVGLLRAVNLGSHQQVSMAALREAMTTAGFDDVRTYVQSGNMVFTSSKRSAASVRTDVERVLAEDLGVPTPVIVRTAGELAAVIEKHPFGRMTDEPTKYYVTFLDTAPTKKALSALAVPKGETGRYWVQGREIYQWMPTGRGQTKLTGSFFEKGLGVIGTGRNWRTVTTLGSMTGG